MENCLLEVIKDAKNDKTIGEIRKQSSESFLQHSVNHPLDDSSDNEKPNQNMAENSDNIERPDEDPIARRIRLEEEVDFNPHSVTCSITVSVTLEIRLADTSAP